MKHRRELCTFSRQPRVLVIIENNWLERVNLARLRPLHGVRVAILSACRYLEQPVQYAPILVDRARRDFGRRTIVEVPGDVAGADRIHREIAELGEVGADWFERIAIGIDRSGRELRYFAVLELIN